MVEAPLSLATLATLMAEVLGTSVLLLLTATNLVSILELHLSPPGLRADWDLIFQTRLEMVELHRAETLMVAMLGD